MRLPVGGRSLAADFNGMTQAFDVADVEVRARRLSTTRLLPLGFLLYVVAWFDATAISFFL
jgi:hypothetical protein